VSRPHADALRARGMARSVGVLVASALACVVAAGASWLLVAVPPLALGGAGATAGSRWYVTPFFATTIVLSLLLAEHTETAAHWFVERVGATLLGVVVAAVVGWAAARWTTRP
ncbi:FUSC family protein, partial [Cellulomonas triticagri]